MATKKKQTTTYLQDPVNLNLSSYNRTLCGVFEDMRNCIKTMNFAPMLGLVEEAQAYANRMEGKLMDIGQYDEMKESYKEMKEELKRYNKG